MTDTKTEDNPQGVIPSPEMDSKPPATRGNTPNMLDQEKEDSWDMSQERAFMENLLGQRFNFYLVFYSLVIAGALSTESQGNLQIVLSIGAVIVTLLALPIFRAQYKLDLILSTLFKDEDHPVRVIDDKTKQGEDIPFIARLTAKGSRRGIVGYVIPALCSVSLIIGAILAFLGVLTV